MVPLSFVSRVEVAALHDRPVVLGERGAHGGGALGVVAVARGGAQPLHVGGAEALGPDAVDDDRLEPEARRPPGACRRARASRPPASPPAARRRRSRCVGIGQEGLDLAAWRRIGPTRAISPNVLRRGEHRQAVAGGGRVDDDEVVGAVARVPARELRQLPHLRDRDQLLGARARRRRSTGTRASGSSAAAARRRRAAWRATPGAPSCGSIVIAHRFSASCDLGLRGDALAPERARHAVLLGDLADDRPPARLGGRQRRAPRRPSSCRRRPCR